MSKQIERIMQMEAYMDEVSAALQLPNLPDIRPQLTALADYMHSGLWLRDYQDDEAGCLPADLKRGVLSQDALYDLLTRCQTLLARNHT